VSNSLLWLLFAAELVAFVIVAPRLWRSARGAQMLAPTFDQGPTISVIVPARNEATRIGECLAPLRDAPGVVEVIVVDDESTDTTATIAREFGATVLSGQALPAGWVGKIWALQQGITAAKGDIVVTLDADARPAAELPSAAAAQLLVSGAVLATVAPRFRTTSHSARWLHAAMLTSLVYRHGAGAGRATKDAVANGQCMVFRRSDAVHGDWCTKVRGEIIEDVALVRWLLRNGNDVRMFDGTRLLVVQMYEGFVDTFRGWGRSLALTGVDRTARQWLDVLTTALTLAAPLWLLFVGIATPVTALLVLMRLGTLIGTARTYERRGFGYWLSPLADLLVWFVVVRGVVSPSREWRGRQY